MPAETVECDAACQYGVVMCGGKPRPAFLDGVVHVFVVAVGQKMYSVLGLCMHAGILIYVGHRLPEIENR